MMSWAKNPPVPSSFSVAPSVLEQYKYKYILSVFSFAMWKKVGFIFTNSPPREYMQFRLGLLKWGHINPTDVTNYSVFSSEPIIKTSVKPIIQKFHSNYGKVKR